MALPVRLTATKVAVATIPNPMDLNEPARRLRLMLQLPVLEFGFEPIASDGISTRLPYPHAPPINLQQKCGEFRRGA
jgi:hypothetical protein